jgi:predicted hydrocarbon binding protein
MADVEKRRGELDGLMVLMASLSHGLEQTLGRGASTVTFRAGRTVGLRAEVPQKTGDPVAALDLVRKELEAKGISWPFEPWKAAAAGELIETRDGKKVMKLVFHNCMVRCALFRYSHEQKQSLCLMNHGLFCGFFQKITGKKAELDVIHAGESACLKELVWEE